LNTHASHSGVKDAVHVHHRTGFILQLHYLVVQLIICMT